MQVRVLLWLCSIRSRACTVASDPDHLCLCGSTRDTEGHLLFKAQVLSIFRVLNVLRVMQASLLEVAEVTS